MFDPFDKWWSELCDRADAMHAEGYACNVINETMLKAVMRHIRGDMIAFRDSHMAELKAQGMSAANLDKVKRAANNIIASELVDLASKWPASDDCEGAIH